MEISPHELEFDANATETQTRPLYLKNTGDKIVIYKVKTTAPETYCARPNATTVPPGKQIEVSIIRSVTNSKSANKAKDKFVILSTPIEQSILDDQSNTGHLWKEIERSNQNLSQDNIRVVLTHGSDSHNAAAAGAAGVAYQSHYDTANTSAADDSHYIAANQSNHGQRTKANSNDYDDNSRALQTQNDVNQAQQDQRNDDASNNTILFQTTTYESLS